MIIGQHYFDESQFFIRYFDDQNHAADYLDMIAQKDKEDEC